MPSLNNPWITMFPADRKTLSHGLEHIYSSALFESSGKEIYNTLILHCQGREQGHVTFLKCYRTCPSDIAC